MRTGLCLDRRTFETGVSIPSYAEVKYLPVVKLIFLYVGKSMVPNMKKLLYITILFMSVSTEVIAMDKYIQPRLRYLLLRNMTNTSVDCSTPIIAWCNFTSDQQGGILAGIVFACMFLTCCIICCCCEDKNRDLQ